MTPDDIEDLNASALGKSPKEILTIAYRIMPDLCISFSGAEDVILIDLARKVTHTPSVFTLDTGRLHPETYRFIDAVSAHFGLPIDVLFPESQSLELLLKTKGLFSFLKDGHDECCGIRKVAPLRRKLGTVSGWITGQRQDQSPTRRNIRIFEEDRNFAKPGQFLLKVNPLAHWTLQQVWDYIRMFDVPYNPLHDRGFVSIGCEPCTRPVHPGQHEREGRWWWEEATAKECGLHKDAISDPVFKQR